MGKHTGKIIFATLIVSLAALVVHQHQTIIKLRTNAISVPERETAPPNVVADAQPPQREAPSSAPSSELLRLRSEVALAREDRNEFERIRKENEVLQSENRQLLGPTINQSYELSGFDTNSLPDVELGTTKDDIFAELRRTGASIFEENELRIHAQAFSTLLASSNRAPVTIDIYLALDDNGKLAARTDRIHYSP